MPDLPLPKTTGSEFSGIIEKMGSEVKGYDLGDEVFRERVLRHRVKHDEPQGPVVHRLANRHETIRAKWGRSLWYVALL